MSNKPEEESSPLIPTITSKENNENESTPKKGVEFSSPPSPINGWTADGLPLTLMSQPRNSWNSGLSSCFGSYDEFFSSNLEGSCESVTRQFGCGGSFVEDEVNREQCEMASDFVTHVFCHPCSLCQEGREIRRRLAHPGFNAQPVVVMIPPAEQTMGRH